MRARILDITEDSNLYDCINLILGKTGGFEIENYRASLGVDWYDGIMKFDKPFYATSSYIINEGQEIIDWSFSYGVKLEEIL